MKSIVLCLLAMYVTVEGSNRMWISSSVNDERADRAMDGDKTTCATTGRHTYSWWYVKFPAPTTVSAITINGVNLRNVYLTVTNDVPTFKLQNQRTLKTGLCNVISGQMADNTDHVITCTSPINGQYVVLEMLPPGDGSVHVLRLCEVVIS